MFGTKDGFDVVIGNPPYHQLSKDKSVITHYKNYLKNKYKTSGGRLNLFIFFTHEAINLSKNNTGVVSYIIPNTILTQEYYKDTRKLILENCNLSTIVDYNEMPFENAVVENITFILENKKPTGNNRISVYKDNLLSRNFINEFSQDSFLKQKNYSFCIYSNEFIDSFFENELYKPLSFYCDVNQGIALKGNKSLSLKSDNPEGKYFKLLDGRNINKYSINWDGVYLDYNLNRIHSCKRKDIFESEEKLFFRRVSKDLIFTYDNEQYFALNTIVVVNLKNHKDISLRYLLAILNSKLLTYLYQNKFKSTKTVFSEIQARSVKELPIAQPDKSIVEIFEFIVKLLLYLNNITELKLLNPNLQNIINSLVFELYFPEHMKKRNIDILQFVEKDLKEVIQNRDFNQLTDDQKEKVIMQLQTKWTDPKSEIVKRMNSFAEKSPDILKPILESR